MKDALIVVNVNVYFQQYAKKLKGPFCIQQRDAWQLIPGIIIYCLHLDYKWHDVHGTCSKHCLKTKVTPPPVDGHKRSGG